MERIKTLFLGSKAQTSIYRFLTTTSTISRDDNNTPNKNSPLTLLTWNINGLDHNELQARCQCIVTQIDNLQPDIAFLQEVVPYSLGVFRESFQGRYDVVSQHDEGGGGRYFVCMLIRRATLVVLPNSIHCVDFPTSQMGRSLLGLTVQTRPAGEETTTKDVRRLRCYTTHLASMSENYEERTRQIKMIQETMVTDGACSLAASFDETLVEGSKIRSKVRSPKKSSSPDAFLFGGDLNVRDWEIPEKWTQTADVWALQGKNKELEHTWDLSRYNHKQEPPTKRKCQFRYDRLFLFPGVGKGRGGPEGEEKQAAVRCSSFALLPEAVVNGFFVSDHLGLISTFDF